MLIDLQLAIWAALLAGGIYFVVRIKRRISYWAILSICTAIGYPLAYVVYFSWFGSDTLYVYFVRFSFGIGILTVGSSIITGRIARNQIKRSSDLLEGDFLASDGTIISWLTLVGVLTLWLFWIITTPTTMGPGH